ncbi:hypothetical protein JCM19235_852 [Vibrio maritimus]|uniref:Uncharacterized protein n=1 Tax=Vibrio maritimus TaxID=990268 RepID=A0A090RW85_9VIBR|nr:hypothetical protein JCM19235_852 [Vibrio maritimus]
MQKHTADVEQIYNSYGIPSTGYQNLERKNELESSQSKWSFLQSNQTVQTSKEGKSLVLHENAIEPSSESLLEGE